MRTTATTPTPLGEPIPANWTIADLLAHLSDDRLLDEPALLPPLAALEAAVTGSTWSHPPAAVALVRSIVAAAAADPALRERTVTETLAAAAARTDAAAPLTREMRPEPARQVA